MASDEKTYNTKVVDIEKLWNFVVYNFLIWIRLKPQTLNLLPDWYNIWEQKWSMNTCDGVVQW